jgi:hypothetical protein
LDSQPNVRTIFTALTRSDKIVGHIEVSMIWPYLSSRLSRIIVAPGEGIGGAMDRRVLDAPHAKWTWHAPWQLMRHWIFGSLAGFLKAARSWGDDQVEIVTGFCKGPKVRAIAVGRLIMEATVSYIDSPTQAMWRAIAEPLALDNEALAGRSGHHMPLVLVLR